MKEGDIRQSMTNLGFLKAGDYFLYNNKKYKAGHVIDGTNGYVACIEIVSKKVERLHMDLEVEWSK